MAEETQVMVLASTEVRAARKQTCSTCEFKNTVVPVCNACGCLLPAKVMLVNSTCPKDKWAE